MTTLTRIACSVLSGVVLIASAGVGAQSKEGLFKVEAEPIIKGLPYSGEGITTVKLAMLDGTKTERTVTAKLFRDSAGRTRREQPVVGFEAIVHIVDPVAGVLYTLNPGARTADRLPLSQFQGGAKPMRVPFDYAKKVEALGAKDIDGLSAQGQRTTTTIPSDQVGNSRPIDVIDERWESTELKVLLRSLHRDPRSGDIEYALTKISRAEPPASLFTVPAGYTIRTP